MPPRALKAGAAVKEDATSATLRSMHLRREASARNVKLMLKECPWVSEDLEKYLLDIGLSVNEQNEVIQDRRPQMPKKRGAKAIEDTKEGPEQSERIAETYTCSVADVVPSTYYKLHELSYSILSTRVLAGIDEDFYSTANIKKACKSGNEGSRKEFCLRRIVFESGVPEDLKLNGKFRVFPILIEYLVNLAKMRESRGRTIGLKQTFEDALRVYRHETKEERGDVKVTIFHEYGTKAVAVVPSSRVPSFGDSFENLYIDKAYSEKGAVLMSRSSPGDNGVVLHTLFKATEFPTVPLALSDKQQSPNKFRAIANEPFNPPSSLETASAEPAKALPPWRCKVVSLDTIFNVSPQACEITDASNLAPSEVASASSSSASKQAAPQRDTDNSIKVPARPPKATAKKVGGS